MSLFSNKTELEIIEHLVYIIRELIDEKKEYKERRKPILVLIQTINNSNYIIMNTTLTLGLNAISTMILVDNKTLLPVTVTFSGQTVTSDNPSVATFAMDANVLNQVNATPVAIGSGNIILNATATYTDSVTNLSVTAPFTATYAFSVTQGAEGLTLSLTDFVNVPSTTSTTTTTTTV